MLLEEDRKTGKILTQSTERAQRNAQKTQGSNVQTPIANLLT